MKDLTRGLEASTSSRMGVAFDAPFGRGASARTVDGITHRAAEKATKGKNFIATYRRSNKKANPTLPI
jgi:hypothetical protein